MNTSESESDLQPLLPNPAPLRQRLIDSLGIGYFTTMMVFAGVAFAWGFVEKCMVHGSHITAIDFLSSCAAWDGPWYIQIVDQGYVYIPGKMCNVAFFPAYPTLAAGVKWLTGCRTELALLIVSNSCLLATVILLREYVALRFKQAETSYHELVITVFCLFPTTFFFRMTYTESLFMLCCVGTLYGMERKWNPVWIALVAGVATATRTVGVALLVPLVLYLWQERKSLRGFVLRSAWVIPLAMWGLAAFIVYQWAVLGEPFAFLKAQKGWEFRAVPPFWQKCGELLILKPIWGTYVPGEPVFQWESYPPKTFPEFNFMFWNPIYWSFALLCVCLGSWQKILNRNELLLSLALLLIPYYLQGPRAGMMSCGRYAAVVFPMYFVIAHWLEKMPRWCQHAWLGTSAIGLFVYAGMFARWYWYY